MSAVAQQEEAPPVAPKDGVPFTVDFQFKDSSTITFSSESLQAWIDKVAQENFPFWRGRKASACYTEPWGSYELKYRFLWKQLPCYQLSFPFCGAFGLFGFPSKSPRHWHRTNLHCGRGKWWQADGDIWMPIIEEQTWANPEVVMSLSPMEVRTLRGSHKKCRGKVLVGGLGLGHSAAVVAARKNVSKVVVVERSKYLCETIGKHMTETSKGKIEVVHKSVWEYLGIRGREDTKVELQDFDTLFIDIWNGYGGNKGHWEFKQLEEACAKMGRRALAWG